VFASSSSAWAVSKPVLTFGECMGVCIPEQRGTIGALSAFHLECAGAEFNTAVGLARLGTPVVFAGAVGQDPFGHMICRELRAEGVEISQVSLCAGAPTGIFFKQWTGLALDADVYYYRGNSAMGTGLWHADTACQLAQAGHYCWIHATGITWMIGEGARAQAEALIRAARLSGTALSFDVNLRRKLGSLDEWRTVLRTVYPFVTWLLLGDSEAQQLYGTDDPQSLEHLLTHEGFAGLGLIVKQGDKGATAVIGGQLITVPAVSVRQVVDTVGAGDGFNAGWIAGMLRGFAMEQALALGALVGAYAVVSTGDCSGYPTWEMVASQWAGTEGVKR